MRINNSMNGNKSTIRQHMTCDLNLAGYRSFNKVEGNPSKLSLFIVQVWYKHTHESIKGHCKVSLFFYPQVFHKGTDGVDKIKKDDILPERNGKPNREVNKFYDKWIWNFNEGNLWFRSIPRSKSNLTVTGYSEMGNPRTQDRFQLNQNRRWMQVHRPMDEWCTIGKSQRSVKASPSGFVGSTPTSSTM